MASLRNPSGWVSQVTLWGVNGIWLNDYAAKPWAGLYSTYYSKRWSIFANALSDAAGTVGGAVAVGCRPPEPLWMFFSISGNFHELHSSVCCDARHGAGVAAWKSDLH